MALAEAPDPRLEATFRLPSSGFFSTAGDPSLLTRVHPYRDNQAIGKCKEVKNGRDQEDG